MIGFGTAAAGRLTQLAQFCSRPLLRIGPAARALLNLHEINPTQIPTQGNNVLNKSDVLEWLRLQQPVTTKTSGDSQLAELDRQLAQLALGSVPAGLSASHLDSLFAGPSGPRPSPAYVDLPLSAMRRTIAKRLSESKSSAPHQYTLRWFEMDSVLATRRTLNERSSAKNKISVSDILVKCVAVALKEYPSLNCLASQSKCDISMAVATEGGLITPIVAGADRLSMDQVAETTTALISAARAGKLKPEQFMGGSMTISNLGMMGINHFTAIINPPQVAILAVGTAEKWAVRRESGQLAWTARCSMQLSSDARSVDQADAAAFLQTLQTILSDPANVFWRKAESLLLSEKLGDGGDDDGAAGRFRPTVNTT